MLKGDVTFAKKDFVKLVIIYAAIWWLVGALTVYFAK
jgi:hypothetical protein